MFSLDDFGKLQFLEGRWKGQSADGKDFYEEYDRPDQRTFRSRRYNSDAFTDHSDGSTISFLDGEVLSTWGEFTWRRIDDSTLEAHQRWSTDGGEEQQHTIRMTKVIQIG